MDKENIIYTHNRVLLTTKWNKSCQFEENWWNWKSSCYVKKIRLRKIVYAFSLLWEFNRNKKCGSWRINKERKWMGHGEKKILGRENWNSAKYMLLRKCYRKAHQTEWLTRLKNYNFRNNFRSDFQRLKWLKMW